MHPTTTQHINPELNQSPVGTQGPCVRRCARVGTQRVALRITSANTGTDAPVETLRATSPTHHAPMRHTRRSTLRLYNGKWSYESLPTHGDNNATRCVPTWDSPYSMGLRGNARKDTESYVSTPGIKTNRI